MDTRKDHLKRRCPRLGGPITFQYCRKNGDNKNPCWKVFDCWWELFDIVTHMRTYLTKDQFEKLTEIRPKPKLNSLVELIVQAKLRNECGD